MCLARSNLSLKARRFLAIGSLCLVAGLLMSLFDKDLGRQHASLYDALRGFLIGLSVAFNFVALRIRASSKSVRA
jgi:hypothetical protein